MKKLSAKNRRKAELRLAQQFLILGADQARIRTLFTSQCLGVKLYYLCFFDTMYPDLRIVERCLNDELDLLKIRHSVLMVFGQRTTAADLENLNRWRPKRGLPSYTILTKEEVADYLDNL